MLQHYVVILHQYLSFTAAFYDLMVSFSCMCGLNNCFTLSKLIKYCIKLYNTALHFFYFQLYQNFFYSTRIKKSLEV
ncbi:MAG: hypothetical protein RL757_445 [Bacteroidota bacterium]|jgi:hypothetical protein